MRYLLDTNACIRVLNNSSKVLVERFRQISPKHLALCSIVKAELLYGARKSARPNANLESLKRFFAPLRSLAFDDDCAAQYGYLRADLAASGTQIGANDMLIAAIARQHDLTVVTHNTAEFRRVINLRVEDWESVDSSIPDAAQLIREEREGRASKLLKG